MKVTREEFELRLKNNTLFVSLIGMSNAGKSERARKLVKAGFFRADIDAAIIRELKVRNMDALAEWLGFPNSPQYKERAAQYLELENRFTLEALDAKNGNTVIDTTGSVVHLPKETLEILKKETVCVHLAVSQKSVTDLRERFFKTPKPLIWGKYFTQHPDESFEEAIMHSYPMLLKARLVQYEKLADVTLQAERIYALKGQELLEKIASVLK